MDKGYPTHVAKDGKPLDWEDLTPQQLVPASVGSAIKAAFVLEWIDEQPKFAAIDPRSRDYEALEQAKRALHQLVQLDPPETPSI